VGDLLGRVLDDHVVVGGDQRLGIAHVDLGLPGVGLALGVLDRMPAPWSPLRSARIRGSSLVVWKMW
jgi:hypothetical protein